MEEQINKLKREKAKVDKQKVMVSILRPLKLLIGKWKFEPTGEGDDLVVRGYFVRKQLTWEVLRNGRREKIEIHWSNIVGIRSSLVKNEPGILEVELSHPPKFYKEIENVEQRAHEKWVDGSDFTGSDASNCRRHLVMFPPGMLDKHYERLINFDKRLWELSKKPYPSSNEPYFKMPSFRVPTELIQPNSNQIHNFTFKMPSFRVPTQLTQPDSDQTHQLAYDAPNLLPPRSVTTNFNPQQNSSVGDHINMGAPEIPNTALNGHSMRNMAADCSEYQGVVSNGNLENNSAYYCNRLPNTSFSDWPTDQHGVWLPSRLQTKEQQKRPHV